MEMITFIIINSCGKSILDTKESIKKISDCNVEVIDVEANYNSIFNIKNVIKGDYVCFVTNDCIVREERLIQQIKYLSNNSELDGVGGGTSYVDKDGNVFVLPVYIETDPQYIKAVSIFKSVMDMQTILLKRKSIKWHELCTVQSYWSESVFLRKMCIIHRIGNIQCNAISKLNTECEKDTSKEDTIILFKELGINVNYKTIDQIYDENGNTQNYFILLNEALNNIRTCLIQNSVDKYFDIVCRNLFLEKADARGVQENEALYYFDLNKANLLKDIPLVSVIIPTYNRANAISRSISSVLRQTYNNIEIIIIDDCSTDETKEIVINIIKKDSRIKYIRNDENSGPAKCRNIGVKNATGKYIAFHDDDDLWHKDKLEIQMSRLLADESLDISFGKMTRYMNGEYINTVLKEFDWYNIQKNFYQEELLNNYIGAPTVVMKKECFNAINGFKEQLRCLEDWEFAISVAKECKVDYVSTPLIDVFVSNDSVSFNIERYIIAWSYILRKSISDVVDKGNYLLLMKKHLRNILINSTSISEDLEFARKNLELVGVDELLISIMLDADEIRNYSIMQQLMKTNSMQRMEIEKLVEYKEQLLKELGKSNAYKEQLLAELEKSNAYKEQLLAELEKLNAYKKQLLAELEKSNVYKEQLLAELEKLNAYKERLLKEINNRLEYEKLQQNEILVQMEKVRQFQEK